MDEIEILNSWKERLNKFFRELQADGWILDDENELLLVFSSKILELGRIPIETVGKLMVKDPTMHPTEIVLKIRAHLLLKER